jgi:hypothetical protein
MVGIDGDEMMEETSGLVSVGGMHGLCCVGLCSGVLCCNLEWLIVLDWPFLSCVGVCWGWLG